MSDNLYALRELSVGEAAGTAIFGYCVVFVGLVLLMIVLYCTGAYFKSKDAKAEAANLAALETGLAKPAAPVAPVAPKKKNFLVPILIIAGVLLVGIIVGAIFLLPNLMFSGKKAIDNEITEIFSKTKNTLIDSEKYVMNYDLDKESLGFEGTLSIESDYKDDTYDFTKLKDYKLNYSGVIDKKENAASGVVTLSKNSTDLATMDGYITGKDMYVYMKEIFKKTIHMESDSEIKDLEFSKTQDMNDILKLI